MNNEKVKKINEGIVQLQKTISDLRAENAEKEAKVNELQDLLQFTKDLLLSGKGPEEFEKFEATMKEVAEAFRRDPVTEFNIKHFEKIIDELRKLNAKEPPEFPAIPKPLSEMKISNLDEIRPAKEVKVSNLKELGKLFTTGLTGVTKGIVVAIMDLPKKAFNAVVSGEVKVTNKDIADAIPVRLASKDLRFFYDALTMISSGPAGSGGGTTDQALLQSIINAIEALGGSWYDSVAVTYPAGDTEVYTYSLGGTTVQTVTVVYTDATKVDLESVTKS